jgi:hypothetical protein
MNFNTWRLKLSLSAVRDASEARPAKQLDLGSALARWRDAMARERNMNWPNCAELIPVRVPVRRQRD